MIGAFLQRADGCEDRAVLNIVLPDGVLDGLKQQIAAIQTDAVDFLNLSAFIDIGGKGRRRCQQDGQGKDHFLH